MRVKKQLHTLLNLVISLTGSTVVLVFLTAGAWDAAVKKTDCETCEDLKKIVEFYRKEAKTSTASLARQKAEIQNLQPNEDAKKMKMASQIFFITAKIETSENMMAVKEKEMALVCHQCAKPKPAKAH
jgi:hypothetical protein